MNRQETKTEPTRSAAAKDASGHLHMLVVHTTFIRNRYADGQWSEWQPTRERLTIQGEEVHLIGDGDQIAVQSTGVVLTLVPEASA